MSTTGSDLKERVQVQRLLHEPETHTYAWAVERGIWAAAEQDTRNNLFSSVGVGARGVTFTIRKSRALTLINSFLWRGQFCFLTSIVDGDPGFQVVKAALCEPASLTAEPQDRKGRDGLNRPVAIRQEPFHFPGILTEKYFRNEADEVYRTETLQRVLVTPKVISLRPGDLVRSQEETPYTVRQVLDLDPYKNEYILERRCDA